MIVDMLFVDLYMLVIYIIYTYNAVSSLCRYCVHDSLVLLHALNFDPLNAGGPDDWVAPDCDS